LSADRGAGNQTIARIISGLYETMGTGKFFLNGKPRATIPERLSNNSLAMVDQEYFMFGGNDFAKNLTNMG